MTMRTGILLMITVLILATVGTAQVETEKLIKSIDTLKSYEYGNTGGVDLRWVETQVGMASGDASVRGAVEEKLIEALSEAKTNDAKQFFCRQLRTVGTVKAVPQLESMLTDPSISHMARYALGRIDAPQARQALHRALGKTSGSLKAGIINTLVKTDYRQAAGDIVKLAQSGDKDVAIAAIKAAGVFGGREAAMVLQKLRRSASADVCVEIDAALLRIAETFLDRGDKKNATAIYEAFYTGDYPEHLRTAGLRGLARAKGEEAADLLVAAIQGDDPALRRNAIAMMALIKGQRTTDTFVKLSKTLPADAQELIVRSLAERGDASAVPAVIDMTTNENENVRLAALEALGDIGTPQAVKYLAKAAARAGNSERQIARASLVRMRGQGIDDAFIDVIRSGDSDSRVEVIRAIGQRGKRMPFAILHRVAKTDADSAVRHEAILSMGRVGNSSDLATLVALAVAPKEAGDRSAAEKAVVILFGKIRDKDAQAAPILTALKTAPDEAKGVLLSLLTKPATSDAFAAVCVAAKSSNGDVSDAAIRALGDWPDAAPVEQLHGIASTSSNPTHRILALRSYIRMAPLTKNPTETYLKAMELVTRKDEIRLVLGGLHYAGSLKALETAEKYMVDRDLEAEAYLAATQVANVYCWQDKARAKATLERVLSEAPSDHIKNQAREVLGRIARRGGLVGAWKAAGPYVLDGVSDGPRVFRTPFPPEEDADAKGIRWQVVLPQFSGDRIDLEKTFGGIDYCSAYLRTTVHSPATQQVRFKLEVDDYIKAWLNGEAVSGQVTLRKGANTLMLKVGDHGGGWNFKCEMLTSDGAPVEGVRFEIE